MLFNYRIKNQQNEIELFRITAMGGYYATLLGTSGSNVTVPIKHVTLVSHSRPLKGALLIMSTNPQNCDKKTLLVAVDELNKKFINTPQLRVKSKSEQEIADKVATAMESINHLAFIENVSAETLSELCAWGCINLNFYGEEEVPDGLNTTIKHTKDNAGNTVQAATKTKFDADTGLDADDDLSGEPVRQDSSDNGEVGNAESSDEKPPTAKDIEKLERKLQKAQVKGKKKKIAKAQEALDSATALLKKSQEKQAKADAPPKEKKPSKAELERLEAIKGLEDSINVLEKTMPEKKKKAKKQQKQIDAMKEELEALQSTEAVPKSEPKEKTAPLRGAAARADREIPEEISWPKPDSITGTIVRFCSKKPRTISEIHKKLVKEFPDRKPDGMLKTVGALVGGAGVPLPLHYTKGIACEVENDGTPEKTVHVTSELPDSYK